MLRNLIAEFFGTAVLVATVIGSGIMGSNLSNDTLVVLIANALATIFMLVVLILLLGPISGAHFNPIVSLALAINKRFSANQVLPYSIAQILGAISGAVLANLMFSEVAIEISTKQRFEVGTAVGEVVASVMLVLVILLLLQSNQEHRIFIAVPAVIGAGYFFTSSTSFANPAVTIGRIFSDTFAGIAPSSAPGFIAFQFVGLTLALALAKLLRPAA